MTTIEPKSGCSTEEMPCSDVASAAATATPDPRAKTAGTTASPSLPARHLDSGHALSIVALVLAGVVLLGAGYLYSFCMPLESACHMGDVAACGSLSTTLHTSSWMGVGALLLGATGMVVRHVAKRREQA